MIQRIQEMKRNEMKTKYIKEQNKTQQNLVRLKLIKKLKTSIKQWLMLDKLIYYI